jgi:hypothetical protein
MRSIEPGIHFSQQLCGTMDSGSAPFGASRNDEIYLVPPLQTHLILPATRNCPGFAKQCPSERQRARGMRERRLRPQPCVQNEKAHKRSHCGHTGHPGIPRAIGFNGFLRSLPGDRALLPPSPRNAQALSRVDTSVGVSGRYDFAVRAGVLRHEHLRVHRLPRPRS